jgi:GNAT superfamily N-acetyltransferase
VADRFVRLARLGDVPSLTQVQQRCWVDAPGMPQGTPTPNPAESERAWERAILAPPSPRHQVWVALEGNEIVGLAALAPASDPDLDAQSDSELIVLAVDPAHRRHGHASRLLSATMQSLTDSAGRTATSWINASDDASRRFLETAGWGADGAHRTLTIDDGSADAGTAPLRQIRLGTDLSLEPADTP